MVKWFVALMFIASALCCVRGETHIDNPNDPYWTGGEWVDMASEATGIDTGKVLDGILDALKLVELKKGYQSPIGQAERAKIIESVTARHGKIWIPRRLSTILGRLEEMLGYAKKGMETWDAAQNALLLGKIIGIAIGAKSLDDAADIFVEERMFQGNALGEAGYWITTIATGLFNGRSFTESIIDGYDDANIGKWSKLGFVAGGWWAGVVNAMPWKVAEREAMDDAFRAALIREGINDAGLAVVDRWLSLDPEHRILVPLKVDQSWFNRKDLENDSGGSSNSDGSGKDQIGDDASSGGGGSGNGNGWAPRAGNTTPDGIPPINPGDIDTYSCDQLSQVRQWAQLAMNSYADQGGVADGYRPNADFLNSSLIKNKFDLVDENGNRTHTVFEVPYTDGDGNLRYGLYKYDMRNGQITRFEFEYTKQLRQLVNGETKWMDVIMPEPPDFVAQVVEKDGQIQISFGGTDSWKDWKENFSQWRGNVPPQFQIADFLTHCVQGTHDGWVSLNGHSEGGGEVQYALLMSLQRGNGSITGHTFNSQRLSEGVLELFNDTLRNAARDRIGNYRMNNDLVSGWGALGEDLIGPVVSLGNVRGPIKAHSMVTVLETIDSIIEEKCGQQNVPPGGGGGNPGGGNGTPGDSGTSGGEGGSGSTGSGSGDNGGAASGSGGGGSDGSGSGNGTGGGTGTGTGSGVEPGDGTEPGAGADPGDGPPEVTVPLPDVVLPNGDGTRPWDDIVGFTIPYDRAFFLLSGDIPDAEDATGAWDGMKNLLINGLDFNEFKKMWETLKNEGGRISGNLKSEIDKVGKK